MGAPDVTVVIPTRDRWRSLRVALGGARRQTGVDLEVVVVDDGGEPGLAERVASLGDPRLRVLRLSASLGPAGARNAGIAEASGRWIAFLDDDDLWAPTKLARQLESAAAAGARWAWCGACYLEPDGRVTAVEPAPGPEALRARLPSGNVIPAGASNVLAETELLREVGGFDEDIFHLPDWDLWLRLARSDRGVAVDEPLVGYVQHPAMLSRQRSEMLDADLTRVEAKLREHGLRATDRQVRRGLLEWIADGQLAGDRRLGAARTFARSAVECRSGTDALRALGALAGRRGVGLATRAAERVAAPAPAAPRAVAPQWLAAYPEFPTDESEARHASPSRG